MKSICRRQAFRRRAEAFLGITCLGILEALGLEKKSPKGNSSPRYPLPPLLCTSLMQRLRGRVTLRYCLLLTACSHRYQVQVQPRWTTWGPEGPEWWKSLEHIHGSWHEGNWILGLGPRVLCCGSPRPTLEEECPPAGAHCLGHVFRLLMGRGWEGVVWWPQDFRSWWWGRKTPVPLK